MFQNQSTGESPNIFKVVGLVVSFLLGVFGFFLSVWKQNWRAGGCSILLELVCLCLLRLNTFYYRNELRQKATLQALIIIMFLAMITHIILLISGIVNLYYAIENEQGFHAEWDNRYATAIPAFVGAFWALVLVLDSRRFQSILQPANKEENTEGRRDSEMQTTDFTNSDKTQLV